MPNPVNGMGRPHNRALRLRLQSAIAARYGDERAAHVDQHLDRVELKRVQNYGTYLVKLTRAVNQPSEFAGTLREGVYACDFADAGAAVSIEPYGPKGPDLGISVDDLRVNVEIKRLTQGARQDSTPLGDWHSDEFEPDARPVTREWVTAKVSSVLRDAHGQLIEGDLNAVMLSDWSTIVARQNFLHAVGDLEAEIGRNGTYRRLNLVEYSANFLGPTNHYVWVNEQAAVPLPPSLRVFFEAFAATRSRNQVEQVQRLIQSQDAT